MKALSNALASREAQASVALDNDPDCGTRSVFQEIRLAADLSFDPSQAATQTFGSIAAKGGGKTYLMGRLAEQLHLCGCPVIVLDPVGNWWGIRVSADGKGPGLEFAVIGGEHSDIMIDALAIAADGVGRQLGTFLASHQTSAVIDISELSNRKRKEFVADFCEELFRGQRKSKRPRMLILEEAQLFAPQHCNKGEERMLGAVTTCVRLGRNHGLGVSMVTQRPQSVSKEVLNQIECLFVGGLRGPQERKAIGGWVTEQGGAEQAFALGNLKRQLEGLPSLKPGDFFCWSPSWLRIFQPLRCLPKITFDGSSTPTLNGSGPTAPKLGPVDVAALAKLLEGEEEPPPETKSSAELQTWAEGDRERVAKLEEANGVQAAMIDDLNAEIARLRAQVSNGVDTIAKTLQEMTILSSDLMHTNDSLRSAGTQPAGDPRFIEPRAVAAQRRISRGLAANGRAETTKLLSTPARFIDPAITPPELLRTSSPDYQQDLLNALCFKPMDRLRLSIFTGKSKGSSTWRDAIAALKASQLISEDEIGGLHPTQAGRKLGTATSRGRGEVYRLQKGLLSAYDQVTLDAIWHAGSQGIGRKELGEKTVHSSGSSTFRDSLKVLRGKGLIVNTGSGRFVISDAFRELAQ